MSARLIFDTDSPTHATTSRVYVVAPNTPAILTAAGLGPTECIDVYVRAGESASASQCMNGCVSGEDDYLWAPLFRCGEPVKLCGDSNQLIEFIPGVYSLGNPNVLPTFPGSINVQIDTIKNLAPELLASAGKCNAPTPAPPAANPLLPVETALAELGCITDASGATIGKAMVLRTVDENTGAATLVTLGFFETGVVANPYTGPWGVCGPDACKPLALRGLTTAW